jgi:ATP-dependent DNA helicase RecQ
MDRVLAALREHFGFPAFRPGQAEAVAAALAGRDLLVVMPTGAGKSLCYQLPALMRDDLAVVVSPLVSLMQDQVDALERAVPGRAALVNAQQDPASNRAAIARAVAGEVRLLYVAPERFSSPGFLEAVRDVDVGLFVVDEAHCVSQWGHDFRPDYFRLADAARWLGARAIVASTATATPRVAGDIAARLALSDPVRVTTGFDRPNLSFAVVPCRGPADKRARLAAALADPAARPAIVYAGTRADTERIAADLSAALGVEAIAYHAGLYRAARAAAQRRFMEGEVEVVVATTAFGMGVDKPDVRFVFHAEVPESVDSYYQEVGRAGRDGEPARAVLFYRAEDLGLRRFFAGSGHVGADELTEVAEVVGAARDPVDPAELQERTELSQSKLATAVSRLEDAGAVEVLPTGHVAARPDAPALDDAVREALDEEEDRREFARSRLEMMRAFAETDGCRRQFVLSYFGEPFDPPCGRCDNCRAGRVVATDASDDPFAVGTRVAHPEWGEGVVQRYEEDRAVVVLFDDVGYKTLALDVVLERGLLRSL